MPLNPADGQVKFYSTAEERFNIASHGLGFILSVLALVLLVSRSIELGTIWHWVSFTVFGLALISLYAASTVYHLSTTVTTRRRLRVVDHAAIYILIAGTYTPFVLVTLHGKVGWILFAVTWGMALTGVILKLFFTGHFTILSTLMYVFMGWLIVFAYEPLTEALSAEGMWWLMAGGVAYTVGAILYAIKTIPFNHAIFHLFVLTGSFCHFWAIYFYVS